MADEIHVIDSHTAGEPTRVVLDGGPALGDGPLDQRLRRFREEFDSYRTAIITEPRGEFQRHYRRPPWRPQIRCPPRGPAGDLVGRNLERRPGLSGLR